MYSYWVLQFWYMLQGGQLIGIIPQSLQLLVIGENRSVLIFFFLLISMVQVDSGGSASDEAVTRPCLVALSCLTPDFYEHLHVSLQVCCSATQAPWHSGILTLNPKPCKLLFGQTRSVRVQRVSRHRVHEWKAFSCKNLSLLQNLKDCSCCSVFWQEQVFGTLILLSSSPLVDIHSAAHGVLHNLKVLPAHLSTQLSLC